MAEKQERYTNKPYRDRYKDLEDEFRSWRDHYKDITTYEFPFLGRYLDTDTKANDGKPRWQNVIDSTANSALDILAAGMQSGLTSQSSPWFKVGIPDKDLEEYNPVSIWLEDTTERIRRVMSRSNFYQASHSVYYHIGGFGTGPIIVDEDPKTIARCYSVTAGEAFVSVDDTLRVDTVYRILRMKAANVVKGFGIDNVSDKTRQKAETSPDDYVNIVQAIEPNVDRAIGKIDNQNMPFKSVYFELEEGDSENVLSFKGYMEFPAMAPRWIVIGSDAYGMCPGMTALSDSKMLQDMQEDALDALALMVDPPMNVPDKMSAAPAMVPGGVNRYSDTTGKAVVTPTMMLDPKIREIEYKIERVQEQIRRAFFSDVFLMLQNVDKTGMTATEVAERHEEKLLMLGPVIERVQPEFLDPVIGRFYEIMRRRGMLAPPPKELEGMEFDIEYISILAQAQKMVRVTSIEQFMGFAGNISAVKPDALDNVDIDATVREYAYSVGVSPKLIRQESDVKAVRKSRADAAMEQRRLDQLNQAAEGAKTLSEVNTGTNNALTQLQQGMA